MYLGTHTIAIICSVFSNLTKIDNFVKINLAIITQLQVPCHSPSLPPTPFLTCCTLALTSVLSATGSHFNKWNYTFKPDEVGLVIGPVQTLQFGSDLWKVWWIWQHLWGVVLKLQRDRERETFKISDIPSFVGSQKRPPSAGTGEKVHFQTISVMLWLEVEVWCKNHENQRSNSHWSYNT